MDMNRNAIWRDPEKLPKAGIEPMSRFWGDESWREAAYVEARQRNFFGLEIIKQGNGEIVAAFRERLRKVAGLRPRPPFL